MTTVTETHATDWTDADIAVLNALKADNQLLGPDAPRGLLSIRLSVLTDETTSPVRQELDLWRLANAKGVRVVGVASDLNVSATKQPPWKRKSLGHWLNDRLPEFDAILFWKLDRFIRNVDDLNEMVKWCRTFGKNLISKVEEIDLSTIVGRMIVQVIGAIAEIEAANTGTRIRSMWEYSKTTDEWITGSPAYGYKVTKDATGRKSLAFDPEPYEILRKVYDALTTSDASLSSICEDLGVNYSAMAKRLRRPSLRGYKCEKVNGKSVPLLDANNNPLVAGPAIFDDEEWPKLQSALDARAKSPGSREFITPMLGVLKCVDCEGHMKIQRNKRTFERTDGTKTHMTFPYLRCTGCKGGGPGIPDPENTVLRKIVAQINLVIGSKQVLIREYVKGEESRQRIEHLEGIIKFYSNGLATGRFPAGSFAEQNAQQALDAAIAEQATIDPAVLEDRWVYVESPETFYERWSEGGYELMTEDLLRAGVTVEVTRSKAPGRRAVEYDVEVKVPPSYSKALALRPTSLGGDAAWSKKDL